jgi:flagellar basal-body rod protein FlgB
MVETGQPQLRATRARHLNGAQGGELSLQAVDRAPSGTNPNGNAVTLEQEMLHAVDTKRQHDRALAIYKSSLSILRSAIGRR